MDAMKKMDEHPVHTTPNHHPSKLDVLTKSLYIPHPAATTFAFSSVLVLLSMVATLAACATSEDREGDVGRCYSGDKRVQYTLLIFVFVTSIRIFFCNLN